uniref:MATH domain-containing protein n=1 Tax=Setaria italica TaxID=4555 RepID=K3XPR5_SETIT
MATPLLRLSVGQVLRSASAIVSRPLSGSHILRIDGCSHLKEAIRHGEGTESCDFNVGDHTWRLLCYPNGSNSKCRRHFAVYLKLVSDTEDEPLGKPVLLRDVGMHKFTHGDSWGFHDFICRKQLEKSEYLKDDRFAILCNVSIIT